MKGFFVDARIESLIERQGYAVVPFASAQHIAELKNYYLQLPAAQAKGTHVTMFNPSESYRSAVDEKIKAVCGAAAESVLRGYRPLYANFMIKERGPEGDFPVHQDWTYVDEHFHSSYAFWIPMQDTDHANGTLHVVPYSHHFLTALRGPHVREPYQRISAFIKEKYGVPVPLKAGEALMWDHRLIHYSLPNISSAPRLAFTLIMVPTGVEVFHCFGVPHENYTEIEKFAVDTDFFMRYSISNRPQGVKKIASVTQQDISFTADEFAALYAREAGARAASATE